eukprot:scaffold100706_cov31-Tisochrysis_lutea.AAC.6
MTLYTVRVKCSSPEASARFSILRKSCLTSRQEHDSEGRARDAGNTILTSTSDWACPGQPPTPSRTPRPKPKRSLAQKTSRLEASPRRKSLRRMSLRRMSLRDKTGQGRGYLDNSQRPQPDATHTTRPRPTRSRARSARTKIWREQREGCSSTQ